MAFSLLLSTSADHNHDAVLCPYGLPTMFQDDLKLPSKPHNVVTETNDETLHWLGYDLTGIKNEELSVIDGYHNMFRHADTGHPSWGYCLESARFNDFRR